MPHISDGEFHAWLDGGLPEGSPEEEVVREHLETCADCRGRLEEARQLRLEAGEILADAAPAPREMVAFEELARRAAQSSEDVGESAGPVRGRWRSLERLAWAATVVLAVGAGWIGREVLTERGWTDPFHTGGAETVTESADAPTTPPGGESEIGFADAVRQEPARGEVEQDGGKRDDEALRRRANLDAEAAEPQAQAVDELSARKSVTVEERAKEIQEDAVPAEGAGEPVGAVEAEARMANEALDRDAKAGQDQRADDVAAPAEPEAEYFRPEMEAPAVPDSSIYHHARPVESREFREGDPNGCYALERTYASGVVLPRVIELRPDHVDTRNALLPLAYRVVLPASFDERMSGEWLPFAADSLWVQMSNGDTGLTMWLAREGDEYAGRGITLRDVAGPTPSGPVRLVPVPCSELDG